VTLTQPRAASRRPTALVGPSVAPAGVGRVITFDETDLSDAIDAVMLARFVEGEQPHARGHKLDRIRDDATLLPPDVTPRWTVTQDRQRAQLAEGDGWTLRTVRWSNGGGYVEVVAATDDLARAVLDLATDGAEEELPEDDPRVEIGFWHWAATCARRRPLPIAASPWAEIRRNYPADAANAFDQLLALDGEALKGRILLIHGPPGTGKTTALRALAKEWRTWCQLDFVIDPEHLFSSAGYLIEVVMGQGNDDKPWRLLLLEDCDELIRPGAKASAGQALSRLLNLTDGLLGQGRQVLVAITTNEDLAHLHPAVTRPGRCLAQIEVGRLPQAQATAWLADAGLDAPVPADGATLAELIALRDGTMPVGTPQRTPTGGLYL
jgi:Domain of unknown function (DUF5925)/ATPase family associated with various cellular activities (AAA)